MSLSARLAGPACPDLFVQWFDSQPGSRQAGLGMVVGVWAQPTCWGTGFFRPPSWLLPTSLCGRSPGRAAAQGLRECSTSRPLGPLTSRAQKPSRRRMNPGCCLSSHPGLLSRLSPSGASSGCFVFLVHDSFTQISGIRCVPGPLP